MPRNLLATCALCFALGIRLASGQTVVKAVDDRSKAGTPQSVSWPPDPAPYVSNAANEAEINRLQGEIRKIRRGGDGSAGPQRGQSAQPSNQPPPVGCVDQAFKDTTEKLRQALNTRLSALTMALTEETKPRATPTPPAAGAAQSADQINADQINHDRMVRDLRAAVDLTQKQISRIPDGVCPLKVTPFNLVTIYEETEKERIQQYNPVMTDQRLTTFSIDKDSKVRIEINPDVLTADAVFGGVKISGTLTAAGGKAAKVEVANYSQVNVDPKSQKSQQAVNLQAASDIKSAYADLYYVMLKLVETDYGGVSPIDGATAANLDRIWWGSVLPDTDSMTAAQTKKIDDTYRQYKNEIESIDDALTSNPALLKMVASNIFYMPQATLQAFLKDFKSNLETMLNGEYQATAQAKARKAVVQTTLDIWSNLQHTQDYIDGQRLIAPNQPDTDAEAAVFEELYQQVIDELRKQIQPGEIDLPSYEPHDGATLAIQVEMVGSAGNADSAGGTQQPGSSVALFTARIKDYRARPELIDATFYVRRMRDVRAQNGTLARVNFAPAPGATVDVVFHSRGPSGLRGRCMDQTGFLWARTGPRGDCAAGRVPVTIAHQTRWNRFFSALAPGIGANVNLLNFTNPAYPLPTGGYSTPDAAATVQIGAGFVGSLFGGALQFTYGWDLNIEAPRSYWGIGFSFVKIGQAAVQKLTGSSSSPPGS